MLGVFAEFETKLRRERQLEGYSEQRRKVSIKPEPSIDVAKVKALRDAGKGPAAIARELKMARVLCLPRAWTNGGEPID